MRAHAEALNIEVTRKKHDHHEGTNCQDDQGEESTVDSGQHRTDADIKNQIEPIEKKDFLRKNYLGCPSVHFVAEKKRFKIHFHTCSDALGNDKSMPFVIASIFMKRSHGSTARKL